MASPPFNINQALPEDDDIVSQFPPVERDMRDIVESWLLVNHNVQGRHDKVDADWSSNLTSIASVTRVWADTAGYLLQIKQTPVDALEYVGVPPGFIGFTAASTPDAGWLAADGSNVSRTTYARLFARIGTTHGVGDGSTTFGLPNIKGRVIAGKETSATLLTSAFGPDGATLGAVGGVQSFTVTTAHVPQLTVNIGSGQGSHQHDDGSEHGNGQVGGSTGYQAISSPVHRTSFATLPAMTGTANTGVTAAAHTLVQPTIILLAQIKF